MVKVWSADPVIKVGVVGGGQLGRMLGLAGKQMGMEMIFLDPDKQAPVVSLADKFIHGSFFSADKIWQLAKSCDVLTYELEHIDAEVLQDIEDGGYTVHPSPVVLATIKDKLKQKEFFAAHNLPSARFLRADEPDRKLFADFGYPLVQKVRTGGYDGKGVQLLDSEEDFSLSLPGKSLIEEKVEVVKELAVMVARNRVGEVRAYPVVEMVFDQEANVLDLLRSPADINPEQEVAARKLAKNVVEALAGVGVFGVEMFLTPAGELLINEVAPRPHNSGHHTIEACVTSQYEQCLRAICGLPLGSSEQFSPAVMINLLGSGETGKPVLVGLDEVLGLEGVSVHIYGKSLCKSGRKMGHVVVLDNDIDAALAKAGMVKECLRIYGVQD